MKLIIVRHGETLWNKHMRLQGQKDIPISTAGLKQAKMLAKKLAKTKIDIIYTSKLKRAIKTAEEIKKYHNGIKIIQDKNLNEISWGIWEGLKWGYIKKKYTLLYQEREKDKFKFKIPKGESQIELKARIKKILNKITKHYKDKTVLIVGHGNVNRTILGILLKWSNRKILSVKLRNASVNILNIKNNKIKLQSFNKILH